VTLTYGIEIQQIPDDVKVYAKFHQAKCRSTWVITETEKQHDDAENNTVVSYHYSRLKDKTSVLQIGGMAFHLINEVTLHRAQLVLGWVTARGQINHLNSRYVTSHLGQLSLPSLRGG